jgi:hypothetical protein
MIASVDWTNLNSVLSWASRNAGQTTLLVFHNGNNYQITHEVRRPVIEAKGFKVVAIVGR